MAYVEWLPLVLLVPVALSCTHVGISSLRIEGAWMVIGQGAGVAAALSAKEDVAVQEYSDWPKEALISMMKGLRAE